MLNIFTWLLKRVFHRKKGHQKSAPQFHSQAVSYNYCLYAVLLFGIQALVASLGSLDLIYPDIPSPIGFNVGRSIHLNLSIIWPLIGFTGAIYYFFPPISGVELYSRRLAGWQFWLTFLVTMGIFGSLSLGITVGREYLEAWTPLKISFLLVNVLFFYNLARTYLQASVPKSNPLLVSMLAGVFSLLIFYLPNIFTYDNQVIDELVRFWVVHLWEEFSMELIGTALIASILLYLSPTPQKIITTAIYLELAVVTLGSVLGTGHHYYWIGVPKVWHWIGGIFSVLQAIPVFLLSYALIKVVTKWQVQHLSQIQKITLAFLLASTFYHLFGAATLGLIMAYPSINYWVHGTYLTSAHSHLALFGVAGFLALAGILHILLNHYRATEQDLRRLWLSFALLNSGLLLMGVALIVAGTLQGYLGRALGVSFARTAHFVWPYLVLRLLGGLTFAGGSSIFSLTIFVMAWRHKKSTII